MAQGGYSKTIVNIMLGWLKGLASWVLRLFNLSGGISPLRFLANNWIQLLVILLLVGLAADLLVWLIRWRPHWVWFRKTRVIINDKNFFADENDFDENDWQLPPEFARLERRRKRRRNWQDNDFVVTGRARRSREEAMRRAEGEAEQPKDVFRDGLININAEQQSSDRYEDEVFSVSDLPQIEEDGAKQPPRADRARAGAKNTPRRGGARPLAASRRGQRRGVSVNKR